MTQTYYVVVNNNSQYLGINSHGFHRFYTFGNVEHVALFANETEGKAAAEEFEAKVLKVTLTTEEL